jgi:hypothetical protein
MNRPASAPGIPRKGGNMATKLVRELQVGDIKLRHGEGHRVVSVQPATAGYFIVRTVPQMNPQGAFSVASLPGNREVEVGDQA